MASGKFPRYEQRSDYDFGPFFKELEREVNDAALIRGRFADRLQPVEQVTFISDEPGKSAGRFSRTARITRELRRVLAQAESSIVMQTPYLILSKPARKLVRELHGKHPGLSIRISTNSFASTDNIMAYSANYRLRNDYIEDLKLEIHEFKPQPATMTELFPTHAMLAELARTRAGGAKPPGPYLCVHAKSLVVDDRVAFIGSYNLDPRSENLNTEVGLLVEDARFARELRGQIERDMRPENAWVIGRRALPLGLQAINGVLDDFLSLAPVDVWPIQNTSSFELKPGAAEVAPWHPDFHRNYREVGSFPGTEGLLTTKEILTRMYKAVGPTLTPIL
jgi:phosphatidylserine/phosphatidylglycerophosphate/cardiolipin synthase-like enzyme